MKISAKRFILGAIVALLLVTLYQVLFSLPLNNRDVGRLMSGLLGKHVAYSGRGSPPEWIEADALPEETSEILARASSQPGQKVPFRGYDFDSEPEEGMAEQYQVMKTSLFWTRNYSVIVHRDKDSKKVSVLAWGGPVIWRFGKD